MDGNSWPMDLSFFSFKVGNHPPLESGLDRSTRMHSPLDLVVLCFGCRLTFALQGPESREVHKKTTGDRGLLELRTE